MEHAISVDRISELERCSPNYHRVYVGSEFCERLIPAEKEVKTALKFCEKNGLGFTLVTPPLTYWGVARVKDILEILPEETEVVINDWGILKDVKRLKLTPVLGRLLVKYKRDPRISSIEGKIPKECREVLQSFSLTQLPQETREPFLR